MAPPGMSQGHAACRYPAGSQTWWPQPAIGRPLSTQPLGFCANMALTALTLTGSTQEAGEALPPTSSTSQPWCRYVWAGRGSPSWPEGPELWSPRTCAPGSAASCVAQHSQPCGHFSDLRLTGAGLPVHSKLPLQDLANAFRQEAQASGKERLLLSAAVPGGRQYIEAGYEVDKIAQ